MSVTAINFKEMTAKELREVTLNYSELSPMSKAMLDGVDRVVFNGQFLDAYKDDTRVYQFGYTEFIDEEYFDGNVSGYVQYGIELE